MIEVEEVEEGALQSVRLVRHRCGYPFWAQVVTRIGGVEGSMAVIEYRSAMDGISAMPLSICPQCGKGLKLWWTVDG